MLLNLSSRLSRNHQNKQLCEIGYIQLIDEINNEVIQQRIGYPHQVEYYAENVWMVHDGFKIVFSMKSDLYQPNKFFNPVKKDSIIRFYNDYLEIIPPKDISPTWIGKAFELEFLEISGFFVSGNTWNAFAQDDEWIGTSEY
ncbi:hypothetical protein ABLV18_27790 [Klebsiella sp. CN_Kp114]|uniref:hypothetical protein n=1 Tax=unclassified Klebsiella TaxID=2608929 RepID=UPI0032B5FC84